MAVLGHLHFQPFRERIDGLDADAVQAAGHLVARIAAEFSARIDLGKDDLDRGNALLGVDLGGDPAPVVLDGAGAVRVDRDVHAVAVARERLVNGIVDDFAHKVMKPLFVRRTDIHAGALADMLDPVEHLNLFRAVCALYLF